MRVNLKINLCPFFETNECTWPAEAWHKTPKPENSISTTIKEGVKVATGLREGWGADILKIQALRNAQSTFQRDHLSTKSHTSPQYGALREDPLG